MTGFTLTAYPDRAAWLESRRFSIGSSDAAGILGESRWSSPTSLNFSKRGLIPVSAPDPEREEALDWHRAREAEIASWWHGRQLYGPHGAESDDWEEFVSRPQHERPLALQEPPRVLLWNPGEFTQAVRVVAGVPISATFDRLLLAGVPAGEDCFFGPPTARSLELAPQYAVASVELKNAHEYMRQHWTTSEPPLIYQLQKQHQEVVGGFRYGYLVASIGGQPPVWAELRADAAAQRIMLDAYRRFWRSVVENEDLPADYSDVTSKAIAARYPTDNGATVRLPEDATGWWDGRVAALEKIGELEKEKDAASNSLKQAIGDATYGLLPDGRTIKLAADKNGKRTTLREEKRQEGFA